MDSNLIANLLVWFVVFIFSTTCHEAAHAWVAYLGGDRTAYEGGQVSLDPMPHIRREPVGMVIIPIVTYFLNGWMLGYASAPVNLLWAQRNPRRYAMVSAAGPMANFVVATLAGIIIWVLMTRGLVVFNPGGDFISLVVPAQPSPMMLLAARALSLLLGLNILLGLFNLIPLPPLDGGGVVEGLFPQQTGGFFRTIRAQGGGIMTLIISIALFHYVGWPIFSWILGNYFSIVLSSL